MGLSVDIGLLKTKLWWHTFEVPNTLLWFSVTV